MRHTFQQMQHILHIGTLTRPDWSPSTHVFTTYWAQGRCSSSPSAKTSGLFESERSLQKEQTLTLSAIVPLLHLICPITMIARGLLDFPTALGVTEVLPSSSPSSSPSLSCSFSLSLSLSLSCSLSLSLSLQHSFSVAVAQDIKDAPRA